MNFTKEFSALEKSQIKLSVTVPQDEVNRQYMGITTKYAKQLQLPGFRKGKIPLKILEQKFGGTLRAETFNEIVENILREVFESADKYMRPLPYSQPAFVGEPDFELEKDLVFAVTYDALPKVALEKTEGYTVEIPSVSVTDADIQKELGIIQDRNALVKDCNDEAVLDIGNIATIDFYELDESDTEISNTKRDGFVFTLGKGSLHYDIDNELLGMKKGQERVVSKTYAKDDADTSRAGKTKKIHVKLVSMKERILPAINDDLAQDVSEKYKTLADLKADITKTLVQKVDDALESKKVNSLLEQMAAANPFELPESMINAELESRWQMTAQQFRISGEQLEQLTAALDHGKSKKDMFTEWRSDADMRLKTRIIVEALLEEHGISVASEDVDSEYGIIAEKTGTPVDEIKKHYDENLREKEYLINEIKEKRLYAQLFEKSTVKITGSISVEKLLGKDFDNDGTNA